MESLLLIEKKEELSNKLKNLKDLLIYNNVSVQIKIGDQYLPYIKFNSLLTDNKYNILTYNNLYNYKTLDNLNIQFNEVVFNIEEDRHTLDNTNGKELIIINKKSDLEKFFKENTKGILYANTKSKIKLFYPSKSNKMITLFEYNFKSAIETKNKICIFRRGSKIKATTLAKQNNFELQPNYYDNPIIYKMKKLHK